MRFEEEGHTGTLFEDCSVLPFPYWQTQKPGVGGRLQALGKAPPPPGSMFFIRLLGSWLLSVKWGPWDCLGELGGSGNTSFSTDNGSVPPKGFLG